MKIGIDASRAFLRKRTGIEEYAYQVITHLQDAIACEHEVVLYLRKGQVDIMYEQGFYLRHNWSVQEILLPKLWTQAGLSWKMFRDPVDVLFIPAHTVPFIHPKRTIVTVHGLEYEFCPRAYSRWARFYMQWTIRRSCQWAQKIIAVSQNTKNDLEKLYAVTNKKVSVIYEGFNKKLQELHEKDIKGVNIVRDWKPYLFFIGRLEERKNVIGIIHAYEILKKKYALPHKLVLAGKPGYNYDDIVHTLSQSAYKNDVVELGYVSENEKTALYKHADAFIFPSLYEGFGLPILEAQRTGTPVIASNVASIPEVAGESALLVDPTKPEEIAQTIKNLLDDRALRDDMIEKGKKNAEQFSWEKCAEEVAKLLVKE